MAHEGSPKDSSAERLISMLTTAVGPFLGELLLDDDVVEVMLNPDGKLWVDRLSRGRTFTGRLVPAQDAERIIKLVASGTGAEANASNPILQAEFPGTGSRFEGILPPIVTAPVFTIRKKALLIFSLEDYVAQGILKKAHKDLLCQAVQEKRNILATGGTGSGKTTLVNAILHEIAQSGNRIVIIEDTLELQCAAPDTVFLRAKEGLATMNDLLKAWNTGHPGGCATIHANHALGGLIRLEQLVQEAVITVPRELIAEAVNLVIHMERAGAGRVVKEIILVEGVSNGKYQTRRID